MKFLIPLALAAMLIADEVNFDQVLNIPEDHATVETQIENEAESGDVSISGEVEVEANQSLDAQVEKEMASIIQSEEKVDEELDSIQPELEDLSHLAKKPAVTISETQEIESENPFEKLPITVSEKQKINAILTTMAENNAFKLLFQKKHLEKLGREVNHVHPMKFLGVVFTDPRLVSCMFEIRRSNFKWDGFIDGFSERFRGEIRAGNVNAFIPGLADSLHVKASDVQAYIDYNDVEGLIIYLMQKSNQK